MRYESQHKPETCPRCGASKIADILYGMPAYSEVKDDLDAGRLVLGGCCVSDDDPPWECTVCNTRVYRKEIKE